MHHCLTRERFCCLVPLILRRHAISLLPGERLGHLLLRARLHGEDLEDDGALAHVEHVERHDDALGRALLVAREEPRQDLDAPRQAHRNEELAVGHQPRKRGMGSKDVKMRNTASLS